LQEESNGNSSNKPAKRYLSSRFPRLLIHEVIKHIFAAAAEHYTETFNELFSLSLLLLLASCHRQVLLPFSPLKWMGSEVNLMKNVSPLKQASSTILDFKDIFYCCCLLAVCV